jgi:hypothetical protein
MMPVDTWKSWSRSGLQSHADLWLIAARTQTQLSECHGQAVQSLIRNWPHLGFWQPVVLPKVVAGFVERHMSYQQSLHTILARGQEDLAGAALQAHPTLGSERIREALAGWPAPSALVARLLQTTAKAWSSPGQPRSA